MAAERNKKEMIAAAVKTGLIILTLLSFLKGVWISLDIDESYAAAVGYRMARGDRLIRDMWEPHQFSGFLAALLTAPYIRLRGNTEYLIIYLRMMGALFHTGMGILLYRRLKARFHHYFAFGMIILHLNFLPKWVQMPEFELMHYWCLLGIFLVLDTYFGRKDKNQYILPFAGGCILVCSMLCYPTMIFLYPFYILALCALEKQYGTVNGTQFWKSSFFFTLGALCFGVLFLVYLFSYMSFDECKRYISYIFLDKSHRMYTAGEKWASYLVQVRDQAQDYGYALLIAVGIAAAFGLAYKVYLKRNSYKISWMVLLQTATVVFVLAAVWMQGETIYGFLFDDQNQFFLQVRYIAFLLPAILLGISRYKKMALWLHLCVIPALVSVAAVLFVTNMDTNVTYAKAFFGVLGGLMMLEQYGREIAESDFWKKVFSGLCYLAGILLLIGLLICRLVLIRVPGCLPVTVRAPLEKMESGAEKGVWILEKSAWIWNDSYRELEKYVTKEDKVLYIGSENLIYAKMEALPATPSVQGTTIFNEMFLYYYEEHPDRIPNVIVYDKTFGENPVYYVPYIYSLQSFALYQWITDNYADAAKTETEHLIILRKE